MNILVTGSNGFIGSWVSRYLKEQGNYIIGLGRREEAVGPVDEYVCCDMSTDSMRQLYDREKTGKKPLDAVVHLAADMRKDPYGAEIVFHNCVGTQRILELCEAQGIKIFVQLSSLPVIGKPRCHPITEEHPLAPPTVYHVTKITGELLADYAYTRHGIRTVSFRISAPIGPGMLTDKIFPVFVSRAVCGKDLVLYGKGTRKQTYIHVRDIAKAVSLALLSADAHGTYNLSSYNCLSNKELADKCVRLLGSKSKVVYSGHDDTMDDDLWDVSIERVRQDLGYEPDISIDEAILEYARGLGRQ